MSTPQELSALQRHFWQLITAPSGVKRGVEDLADSEPGIAPLSGWLVADGEDQAVARLDIYANMYFYRLLDCLREDYVACECAIGKTVFHNVVTDYLLAHPPDNPSLRYLGLAFPDYLQEHAIADTHPYLADLARLEWQRLSVFDAEDQRVLTESDLGQVAPEAWPEIRLEPLAASRLLATEWAVEDLWKGARLDKLESLPTARRQARTFVIWRQGFLVHHRYIEEADERAAIGALFAGGLTFGSLCERVATEFATDDLQQVAQRAATLLSRWVRGALLANPV